MDSLRFSIYTVMSSANRTSFTSSFLPSNIMLNKSEESGHLCLVSDLRGNAFSFSPLSMKLAMGLSSMAFIMLWYVPSILTLLRESFYHKCMLKFVKCLFCLLRWSYDFCHSFCYCGMAYCLICGCWTIIESLEKFHLIMVTILLLCCWILFANILLRIFDSMSLRNVGL